MCRNILIYGECRFESKGCCYSHSQSTLSTTANSFIPTPSATPLPPLDPPTPLPIPIAIAEEYYPPSEYYDYIPEQREPIQYHHYHPSSTIAKPTTSYFLPPSLHTALTQKSEALHSTTPHDVLNNLPTALGDYTSLVLLDQTNSRESEGAPSEGWARYRTWLYKAWNKTTGKTYALRRIEGFRLTHESAIASVEKWARLNHPNLVSVKEAFTTRAFGDQCTSPLSSRMLCGADTACVALIFVHDYYPLSTTLYEAHLSPASTLPPNPWSLPSSSIHSSQSHQQQQQQQQVQMQQQQMSYNGYSISQPDPRYRNTSQSRSGNQSNLSIGNSGSQQGMTNPGLAEGLIWSYLIQLIMAMRTIHNSGLALRNLDASKVLITSRTTRSTPSSIPPSTTGGTTTTNNERIRIRIGSGGTSDVLLSTQQQNSTIIPPHLLTQYQAEDLVSLSTLLLSLTSGTAHVIHNIPKALDHLSRFYSGELKGIIVLLLNGGIVESRGGRGAAGGGRKGVEEVLGMCGAARVAEELAEAYSCVLYSSSPLLNSTSENRLTKI